MKRLRKLWIAVLLSVVAGCGLIAALCRGSHSTLPISVLFVGFTNDGGKEVIGPPLYVGGLYGGRKIEHAMEAVVQFSNRTSKEFFLDGEVQVKCPTNSELGGCCSLAGKRVTGHSTVLVHVPAIGVGSNHWPVTCDLSVLAMRPRWQLRTAGLFSRIGFHFSGPLGINGDANVYQLSSNTWNN